MENKSEIIIYKAEDGSTAFDVKMDDETVWLTQKQIAALFGTEVPAINKHIRNIFSTKELSPKATVSKMETVQIEGNRQVNRLVEFYNLDMIISIGYRVSKMSLIGVDFELQMTKLPV